MDQNALWLYNGKKIFWRGRTAKFYWSPSAQAYCHVPTKRFEQFLDLLGEPVLVVTKDEVTKVQSKMN